MSGPLSHLRVLDFTALVQGPMATQVLGDLGADVIKFERVGGEWMRSWGILNGRSHGEMDSFLAFNRNKRSVSADLKDPAVRERILELAADADVVVENFRPGVMDRLGLGYDDFRAVNPEIIYASSSGYGQTGPYVKRPGQDLLIQALSGLMFLSGRADDPPTALGVGIADQYTALHIVIAVLAALAHRTETGRGQKVEVDLFSCTVAMQQQELTFYLNHGFVPERPKENLGSVWATAPFGIYGTSDGHIAIAMTPCPVLAEALGLPWLAQYDTLDKMVESRADIYAGLSDHFRTDTSEHWIEVLLGHDVWCAAVQDYERLVADPQVAHNGLFWDVPVGEDEATFRTPASPITFSETPASIQRGVPRPGQHTSEIFDRASTGT
ncbi:MAG TPA: CaiB/BaiF CoA-transferase family protein [Baekduia sp.]|nr:CaiB/BaiF CoA-transferase family protein [Baekduia sp.]